MRVLLCMMKHWVCVAGVLIILNDCTLILYLEFPCCIFVSVNMCMCTLLSLMIALWRVHACPSHAIFRACIVGILVTNLCHKYLIVRD